MLWLALKRPERCPLSLIAPLLRDVLGQSWFNIEHCAAQFVPSGKFKPCHPAAG